MVICLPWRPDLGAVRPQFEVAAELRRRGHQVDHFGVEQAFGSASRTRAQALLGARFARVASRRVARIANAYDVIDANEGDLPATKAQLGFDGLLVARSNGLRSFYRAWEHEARRRWPDDVGKYRSVRALRAARARAEDRDVRRAHRNADVFLVLNQAELATVQREGLDATAVVVPQGVTERYLDAVADQSVRDERIDRGVVACVGTWDKRKGARDWPAIVARVLERSPHARFAFIGASVAPDVIRAAIGEVATEERVSVVSRFDPEDLPGLLATASVGALPSYIEGSPLAVLELLAAGVPTVVYDNPGTNESVAPLGDDFRVQAGDTRAFADQLSTVLTLDRRAYADAARACRIHAEQQPWRRNAAVTIESYAAGLERLGREGV